MKAGTLSVKESQNALAKSDPKQLAEDYEQVKVRTQAALATIVENAQKKVITIFWPFLQARRFR